MLYKIEKVLETNVYGERTKEYLKESFAVELSGKLSKSIVIESVSDGKVFSIYKTEFHVFTKEEFKNVLDILKEIKKFGGYEAGIRAEELAKIMLH